MTRIPRVQDFLPAIARTRPEDFIRQARAPRQPEDPGMTPEEEQSFLGNIAHTGMSGLSAAGNLIDLPRSMVEDVIQGRDPLDQLWTPFSAKNRITGREANRISGATTGPDNWGNWTQGLAREIATDPLTYLTFGASALTKAGKIAQKAGVLDRSVDVAKALRPGSTVGKRVGRQSVTLDELYEHGGDFVREALDKYAHGHTVRGGVAPGVRSHPAHASFADFRQFMNHHNLGGQHLAGGLGWNLPGTGIGGVLLGGTGKIGPYSRFMDALQHGAAMSYPGRLAKMMFHRPSGGHIGGTAQELSEYATRTMDDHARAKAMQDALETKEGIDSLYTDMEAFLGPNVTDDLGNVGPDAVRNLTNDIVMFAKEHPDQLNALDEIAEIVGSGKLTTAGQALKRVPQNIRDGIQGIIDQMDASMGATHSKFSDMGGNIGWRKNYAPRPGQLEDPVLDGVSRIASTTTDFAEKRRVETASIPAQIVKLMRKDNQKNDWQHLMREYATYLDDTFKRVDDKGNVIGVGREHHAKALADYLEQTGTGSVYGTGKLSENVIRWHNSLAQSTANLDSIHRLVGNVLSDPNLAKRLVEEAQTNPQLLSGAVRHRTLHEAFVSMGLDPDKAIDHLAKRMGRSPGTLGGQYLPREVTDAMLGVWKPESNPRWFKEVGDAIDGITRLWKAGVTVLFGSPSFQFRNKLSGEHVNFTSGLIQSPADILRYLGAHLESHRLLKAARAARAGGKAVSPEQSLLLRDIQAHQTISSTLTDDVSALPFEMARHAGDLHLPPMFGDYLTSLRKEFKESTARRADEMMRVENGVPLEPVLGVNTKWTDPRNLSKPMRWGREKLAGAIDTGAKLNATVEWSNRVPMLIYLRKKGWTPAAAAAKVEELHFDYSRLSNFEKQVMKRVIPFYCVPDDCEILTREGWKKVDELRVGEDVLSMDHESGASEWAPCEDKAIFDYQGVMLNLVTERDHYTFTPDHRWPVLLQEGSTREDSTGAETVRRIKRGYELRTGWRIPRSSNFVCCEKSVATPREAAVISWVVTDGYMRTRDRSPGHTEYIIYQSPSKHLEKIVGLVGEENCTVGKPHPDSGVIPVRLTGEFRRRIQSLVRTKEEFVDFVCHLSPKSLEASYEAMMEAEGCGCGAYSQNDRDLNFFAQNPGPVLDAFQIVCQLTGRVAHQSSRGSYVSHKNRTLKTNTLGHEQYSGRVWCPQTKHGTWLMRRHGRVIWTGNTFSRKAAPLMWKHLMQRPGGGVGQTLRGYNYAQKERGAEAGVLPDYLRNTLALPVGDLLGKQKEGHNRYLTSGGLALEDPLSFLGGGVRGGLLEGLGRLNPMLKAPLELATGKAFFQSGPLGARELADLDPTLGRLGSNIAKMFGSTSDEPLPVPAALEYLSGNLPTSRLVSRLRTLTDARKGLGAQALNQLTGMRVSDVSPRAQLRALRELTQVAEQDLGARTFRRQYFNDLDLARLTEKQRREAEQLKAIQRYFRRQQKILDTQ